MVPFQYTFDDKKKVEENKKKKRRRFFIFENLRSLALIFLSPILAIGVWFILAQLGIQGQQQGVQGQTGIFVLAPVSFTIGLVTEEAVEYLISFAKERLGGAQQTNSGTKRSSDQDAGSGGSKTNIMDELEKLSHMKQNGTLTEEESQN